MATPESIALAAELLRQKEGIRSKPYWDVNALRAGYGSDTTTLADGTVKRITKDTVVSKEDAERDLARRVTDFANIAQKKGRPNLLVRYFSLFFRYGIQS